MKNITSYHIQANLSWQKSRCKGSWLHDYVIKNQYENAVQEVCLKCGKSIYFKECAGRINNLEYIKHHMKQILLPQHSLFIHEFPNSKYAKRI